MKAESLLYGIGGLLVGIVLAVAIASVSVNNNYTGMMRMMGMHTERSTNGDDTGHGDMMGRGGGMSMSMNDMTDSLRGQTGDEFDKTFLTEMIDHHQGAIDMANLAKTNAKHDELKSLATDIVTAQTREIQQMRDWQRQWGY